MFEKPWYLCSTTNPVAAYQPTAFNATNGWVFDGRSFALAGPFEAVLFFAGINLTPEQINQANELLSTGKAISGRYESWEQFAIVHNLT